MPTSSSGPDGMNKKLEVATEFMMVVQAGDEAVLITHDTIRGGGPPSSPRVGGEEDGGNLAVQPEPNFVIIILQIPAMTKPAVSGLINTKHL